MVSVHMITFNHEKYIAKAIDGVLSQSTNFAFEIIIGDDCSTDSTRRICEEYQARHPGKILLLPSDRNLGAQRNGFRTLSACKGKYIAFCEGDDYWVHPSKLQRQVEYLERNPECSISLHDYEIEVGGDIVPREKNRYLETLGYSYETYFRHQFSQTSTFVLRNVIDLPYWRDEIYAGDFMLVGLAAKHGKMHYIDERLSVYRSNLPNGCTSSNKRRKLALYINAVKLNKYLNIETSGRFRSSMTESLFVLLMNKAKFKAMTWLAGVFASDLGHR